MRKTSFWIAAAFAGLSATAAQAQEAAPTLEERVAKVEAITSKLPAISGFINPRYQYNSRDDSPEGFDIRRARLDVKGDLSKSFDYRLQVDFAGTSKILDAYFRWKVNDYFNLQAGQFKTPFSLENPYSPTNLESVENSLVIQRLVGYSDLAYGGTNNNGRDLGISLSGGLFKKEGYSLVNYSLGVFNGTGINAARDNNKSKDFAGILSVNPIKALTFAGYYYTGAYGANDLRRERAGGGVKYDDGKLLVRGEYIAGKTNRTKSDGYYAVVGYFITPKLQPIVKYDYFKQDKDADADDQWLTLGLNYQALKKVRFQLDYIYKGGEHRGATDTNYFVLQSIVQF